jgi:hypothetical protein
LRRWEELRPEFDERGVRILTLSTDTPDELAKGHRKHRLGATMLSDRELDVTDRFGLRNEGIHSGPPPPIAARALPVPTSRTSPRTTSEGRIPTTSSQPCASTSTERTTGSARPRARGTAKKWLVRIAVARGVRDFHVFGWGLVVVGRYLDGDQLIWEYADGSTTRMDRICTLPEDQKVPRPRGRRFALPAPTAKETR